ncbi:MAG TPA: VOC family protein [Chloroflexia bacterium]|nr:VOC family protein [Chloroflexia bacterium]
MARILGIGGVFFKSPDPAKLVEWYSAQFSVPAETDFGGILFHWKSAQEPEDSHFTIWSAFPRDTAYFEPTTAPYMINYIVDDLDGVLQHLRASGTQVDDKQEDTEYGRFGWAVDPDGVRFELWQPPAPEV